MRNSIEYKLWGRYAFFTDPTTKNKKNKYSYLIPTYQALKGVTESIYWKPSITWYVDKVRIVNQINLQPVGVKYYDIDNNKEVFTDDYYLRDVEYHIVAHFEFNENRQDLIEDWDENKHHNITKRVLNKGGRRDIFLGTRECQGYVEPFNFDEGSSFYGYVEDITFGKMVHGINYPSKNLDHSEIRIWKPTMKKGVFVFPRPEEINEKRIINL